MEGEPLKILTVDDNPDNLTILKALILEAFPSAVVLSALNGPRALESAAENEPDIILLDIIMPGMDGYEVCRRLKDDEKLCDIPVVFVTAIRSNKESRIRALESGAEAFLTKPIDEIELTAQIRAMLKIRAANIQKRTEKQMLAALVEDKTRELQAANAELLNTVEAVKREQALIEAIFDSIPGYLYVYDENGKLIKWNKKHESMTGFSTEELAQMSLDKWFDQEDLLKVNAAVRDVFEKGYGEVEAWLTLKNGGKMLTRSSGVPLVLNGQRYFTGIGIDITEQKRLENMLLESQRIAHLGTWILDLRTDQVVWSEELYKMYGFDPALPPPPFHEHGKLFTQQSWLQLSAALDQTRTSGIPYELELQTITADGSNGWMWVRGEAKTDSSGSVIALWGAAQDITERKRIEIKLKQSEERFQLLFNKAPLGYQSLDSEGRFIEVNQQWLDTFGYSKEEVIGKLFENFLSPEYVDAFHRCFSKFKAEGRIHSEFEMQAKNGNRLFIAFEGKIAYDSNDNFVQTHCILKDITNQRIAESALKESEERYKYLFEYSGVGIGYYTTDGVVISYNQKALENIGGKLEDYVGKSVYELFQGVEAEIYYSRIQKAISNHTPQVYEDYVTINSQERWFSSTFTSVTNANGEVIGVQIASLDITKRKQAEETAAKSEFAFQSLFDEMSSGVAIYQVMNDGEYGADYIIQDFNKAALKAERKDKAEVVGKSLYDLRPNIDQFGIVPVFQQVWKTGESATYPSRLYVDDNFSNWYENRIYRLPSGEIVALFDDVTEKRQAEEGMKHLAFHDHLTDVYNRRFFETEFARLNSESNFPLSIITGDINGLKLINDSLGHFAGDKAIQQFALEIQKQIRGGDSLARIGGDEFGVIIAQMPEEDVKQLSGLLQSSIRLHITDQLGYAAGIDLTATFGYSVQAYPGQTLDVLMKEAETYMYRRKFYDSASKHSHVIDAIMNALFEKSEREQQHSLRVSHISAAIATAISLDESTVAKVKVAGSLHDIGKIGIDESILNKSGRLNEQEMNVMKQHPLRSARILASIDEYLDIVPIVKSHHERMDGLGYPAGLDGNQIPLEARIISVADAFDAMTICRPYRDPITKTMAAEELERCAGSQFDPQIVRAFVDHVLPNME